MKTENMHLDTTEKGFTLASQLAGPLPRGFEIKGLVMGGGRTGTVLAQGPTGRYHRVNAGSIGGMDTDLALNLLDKAEGATTHSNARDSRLFPQEEGLRTALPANPWEGGDS